MNNGTMTSEETLTELQKHGMGPEQADRAMNRILELDRKRRESMAAPGSLGLDPKLEEARWAYGIPDGAFESLPTGDRIFLYMPFNLFDNKYVKGGLIERPEMAQLLHRHESHKGVLVAWGLKAQDELWPYGHRLGHVVGFIQMAPWAKPIGHSVVDGKADHVIILRAGHLVEDYTLEEQRRSGEYKVTVTEFKTARGTRSVCHTLDGLEKEQAQLINEDY